MIQTLFGLLSLHVNQQLLHMVSFWHYLVLSGKLLMIDSGGTNRGGKIQAWEKQHFL